MNNLVIFINKNKPLIYFSFLVLSLVLLFHKPIIEGLSMSMNSLTSEFGNVGPIPAGSKWSAQTITDFKVAFKTNNGGEISDAVLDRFFNLATEDDAKYYISNGHWEWPSFYTNCINETIRKNMADDAAKNKKPAPTEEQIQQYMKMIADPKKLQQEPIRGALMNPIQKKMLFSSCIGSLKESSFLNKMMWPLNIMGGGTGQITTKDNNTIKCAPSKFVPGSDTKILLTTYSIDPTTKQSTSVETNFDQLPSLVSGFKYLKDGKISDGTTSCDCNNFSMCPFSLDEGGVSPFYQAYWGIPSSSESSTLSSNNSLSPSNLSSSIVTPSHLSSSNVTPSSFHRTQIPRKI